ncbi:hypothetical protein GWK47_025118 [Chionoecetes opilio]|uniref:Uncharacterized protein n=1 Tax=Chionoecetes opilio TaxID=41210 RepID=A0A8J4XKJ9_CHIOP|nr:hypothetical protein GWK47_025118 [Chionoecetes opilio]
MGRRQHKVSFAPVCDLHSFIIFFNPFPIAPFVISKVNFASQIKRKVNNKVQALRRALIKDLVKEAANKPSLATASDAGKEAQVMTLFKGTWVRKRAVPRILSYSKNKAIKIKAARKEKGAKELTETEQKVLQRYMRKILHIESRKLRQALLSTRPSVAGKQKPAKPTKKTAKKAAPAKAAAGKAGADSKKQKRPAKKAAN